MIRRSFLASILLLCGLVDIPGNITLGAVSVSGVLTVLIAIGVAISLAARREASVRGFRSLWPLSGLFLLSLLQFFAHPRTIQSYQTLCLLWIFLGILVMLSTEKEDWREAQILQRTFLFATVVASSIYAVSLLLDGLGTESVIGARSFALFALVGIALLLGRWSMGSRGSFWMAVALTLLVALSLSRTGLVVGILLFPLSRLRAMKRRDALRFGIAGGSAFVAFCLLVVYVPGLGSRFLGDNAVSDFVSGNTDLDSSGRAAFWLATADSVRDSHWLGKGPGSANTLIDEMFPGLGHPHNEYLRYLHDSGFVGLTLFLWGLVQLVVRCRIALLESIREVSPVAGLRVGAFLALVGVILTAITDNTFSYLSVMAPVAVFLGIALRTSAETERVRASMFIGNPNELAPGRQRPSLQGSQP